MQNKITLATLSQATEQEVFDQVASHMLTQLRKSASGRICKYRGPEGLMCAAGCLIGDDEYEADTMDNSEDSSWSHLVYDDIVPNAHMELIQDLQHIHDNVDYHPVTDWMPELVNLAKERGLEFKGEEYVRSVSSN